MKTTGIAVATITRVRDEAEEAILTASLAALARLALPVHVTDAGSTTSFIGFLRSQNFILHDHPVKGVWPQAKNSLANATAPGAGYIFYTEPDKQDFFQHHLLSFLDNARDKNAGIVLASRSKQALATFPAFQQVTESTINHCCAELVGVQADYTYGPFLIHRNIIRHLEQLPNDIGWGWRPFAFNIAKRLGYTVEALTGHFNCPAGQRKDTPGERIYRIKQLEENIRGLLLSVSASI